jgi:hypothetical protein
MWGMLASNLNGSIRNWFELSAHSSSAPVQGNRSSHQNWLETGSNQSQAPSHFSLCNIPSTKRVDTEHIFPAEIINIPSLARLSGNWFKPIL